MAKRRCSVVDDGVLCPNDAGYANPFPMCPKHRQRWRRPGGLAAPVQRQVRGRSAEERRLKDNADSRAWRAANPEKRRAIDARERATIRYQVRVKQWYRDNRDRQYASARRWREAHPDKIREWDRRWRTENPDKARERYRRDARRRKARRKQVKIVPYREADIFDRDGWVCQLCHKKVNKRLRYPNARCATIDHILPISLGGDDASYNVQLAHFSCNSAKCVRALGEQLRFIG